MNLKSKPFDLFWKTFLALATVVSVLLAGRSAVRDFGDFQYNSAHIGSVAFRDILNEAQCLVQGYDIYNPAIIHQFNLDCPYLPNSFVFFLPFTALSLPVGRVIWMALNILFTLLLAREISVLFWEKKNFWLVFALIACSAPWVTLMHFGQYSLWSLYFFLLAVRLDKENRPVLSGIALAFSFLKYVLTVPMLLYFLL